MREFLLVLAALFAGLAVFAFVNSVSDIQFFAGFNAIGFAVTLSALGVLFGRLRKIEERK